MVSFNSTQSDWCGIIQDDSFGPTVNGCRGNFDFTLLFEEAILALVPSAVFLLLVPPRLVQLWRSQKMVRSSFLQLLKSINCIFFFALQIGLLVRWCGPATFRTRLSVAAAVMAIVDAVAIIILSTLDHNRSARPSTVLQIYLTLSMLFDIVRTRTIWLISSDHALVILFTAAAASKAVMLLLELTEKRHALEPKYRSLPREATSGFANVSIFWWLNKFLRVGAGKIIGLEELDGLEDEFDSARLLERLQSDWLAVEKRGKHSLLVTTAKSFRWSILAGVFPRLCMTGFTYAQPFLINTLINYIESSDPNVDKNYGYGLIGAYVLVFFGGAISSGRYTYETLRAITKIRGGLVTIIYSKTQELHTSSVNGSASSSLMSTDVERIAQCLQLFHNLWATPIELVIAVYLLERQIGAACAVPVILALGCSLMSILLSTRVGNAQRAWLTAIQGRLNVTTSLLNSIKEIRMTGLTDMFSSIIQRIRLEEITVSFPYRRLLVWSIVNSDVTNTLGPVVTFALFTIISRVRNSQALLATQAFTSLTVLSLIGSPLLILIQIIPQMMSAVGSFTRIQEFLTSESQKDDRICHKDYSPSYIPQSEHFSRDISSSEFELAEVKPTTKINTSEQMAISVVGGAFGWADKGQTVLQDINVAVETGSLTMIIGPVGSGKSTLLKTFLGETRVSKGFVYVSTREMSFCDQSAWLLNASLRQNIIGICEFDRSWYETVVNACALKKDMEDLPLGDQTILGSRGVAVSGGQKQRIAIARAIYSRKDIAIFDDVLTALDATTEEHVFSNVFGPGGLFKKLGATVILVSHKTCLLSSANHIIAIGKQGKILEQGNFTQLKLAGGYVNRLLGQSEESETSVTEEKTITQKQATAKQSAAVSVTPVTPDKKRQTGDLSVYKYFCQASGVHNVVIALSMAMASSFCVVYSSFWLQEWVQANQQSPNKDVALYLCIYALLSIAALVTLWVFCWLIVLVIIPRAGCNLHQNILQSTIQAPLSFLTATDVGALMNRFSQDMQLIDGNLQASTINSIEGIMLTIMRVIIVCVTAKYFATTIPFGLAAVYLIQRYYLRTSRQLRHLDIEAKAPLYSHFLETLNGLATIRAYGWQDGLQKQNHALIDAAQKPFYLLACIQRWLAFVLDILTAVLAVTVVVLAVTLRNTTTGGEAGVALVNVVSMNQALAMLIISWTGLETAVGAVSRVRSFSRDTPSELRHNVEEADLGKWPYSGTICFENVSASYGTNSPPVLKNISMSIKSGESIGICGRTGSGKSSLILCILQMLELQSGSIKIDDTDLAYLSREAIRTSLITISQDTVFVEGTIRLNLDPHSSISDELIKSALKKVHLWDLIETKGGLDTRAGDMHLSHGQQQLFCLARALLRKEKGKILLMDEATSSIDSETNKLLQELIRREFAGYTIIAVDHYLENILDFDKIAVFDTGMLVEFGGPEELLGRASAFRELYGRGSVGGSAGEVKEI